MAVNKQYTRTDLVKSIVQFKADNKGRLPEKEDWANGEIKPSLRTFQRRASIEELILEADQYKSVADFEEKLGELEQAKKIAEYKRKYKRKSQSTEEAKELEFKPKAKRIKSTARKHSGFQCSFCGGWTTGVDEYYSALKKILVVRLIELLENSKERGHFDGVMDCIHAIFKDPDPAVRLVLEKAGYLEAFNQRFDGAVQDSSYKLRCHVCGKLKDEWDVTVDTTKPNCEYICEDCLSKKAGDN